MPAFAFKREIDEHDAVLFDNTDQPNNTNEGDQGELGSGDPQCKQGSESGGRQSRDDGDGMGETLIEDAKHNIYGEKRRQQYDWLGSDTLRKILDIPSKFGMQRVRQVEVRNSFLDRSRCLFDAQPTPKIIGDGH